MGVDKEQRAGRRIQKGAGATRGGKLDGMVSHGRGVAWRTESSGSDGGSLEYPRGERLQRPDEEGGIDPPEAQFPRFQHPSEGGGAVRDHRLTSVHQSPG